MRSAHVGLHQLGDAWDNEMKRSYEIEPVDPAQTLPWRLVLTVREDGTTFNFYWGDKTIPTHRFAVSADEWKEITK
jgi:hypothetical protein